MALLRTRSRPVRFESDPVPPGRLPPTAAPLRGAMLFSGVRARRAALHEHSPCDVVRRESSGCLSSTSTTIDVSHYCEEDIDSCQSGRVSRKWSTASTQCPSSPGSRAHTPPPLECVSLVLGPEKPAGEARLARRLSEGPSALALRRGLCLPEVDTAAREEAGGRGGLLEAPAEPARLPVASRVWRRITGCCHRRRPSRRTPSDGPQLGGVRCIP
ncbi:unnamed protein product [Prorocentrum cordatum]|uniref:Uncharacterized protein n=1 Tax=Prorocentrum cordatum TaxID=2364126 RepID=A0ABN9QM78_9DINO|nr:unnamed protein product [Polarella glacialis]